MQNLTRNRRGSITAKLYGGIWIVLTIVSLAYLAKLGLTGGLITEPQNKAASQKSLAELTRESEEILLRVGRNKNLADQSRNDITALQQTVSDFSLRLDGVEAETVKNTNLLAEYRSQIGNITNSISTRNTFNDNASELRRIDTTGSLQTSEIASSIVGSNVDGRPSERIEYKPGVSFSMKPLPATGFAKQSTDPPKLRIADKSSQPATTQTLFGIHLSAGQSIGEIQKSWEILKKRYPADLVELSARFTKETAPDGKSYQLIAGPFYNILSAVEICTRINRSQGRCEQTLFVGTPLPTVEKNS